MPWLPLLPALPFLSIACRVAGVALLALAFRIEGRRRRAPRLPSAPHPLAGQEVTVLLPVRDEERNLNPCLDSLIAQSVAPRVRVIDDGSTDRTGEMAAARAAAEPRLSLDTAGELPEGWRGKVHALWRGAQSATTPWLLLTDADTRHHSEALARALAGAAEHSLDAVSLAGFQEVRGMAENLLVPAVFGLLDAQLGDWRAAARGGGPPVANGQFLLLRQAAWDRCGGFEAVRGVPLDDVAIARALRGHGFRTGFFRAPELLRVRMYQGWNETSRGWRRNLGGLLGPRPATALAVVALLLLPVVLLLAALVAHLWWAAASLWSMGAAASALLRTGSGNSPWVGLLFPCDALLLALHVASGTRDFRRGRLVSWRGREMRV